MMVGIKKLFGRKNRKIKQLQADLENSKRSAAAIETALRSQISSLSSRIRQDGCTIKGLKDTSQDKKQSLADADDALNAADDALNAAGVMISRLESALELGRNTLIQWRDADPAFTEIIQEIINEYDELTGEPIKDGQGHQALNSHFGLSRASWSVLPRVTLNEMPDLWKWRFTALMTELDAEFPNFPDLDYSVTARGERGRIVAMPAALSNYRYPDKDALKQWRKH